MARTLWETIEGNAGQILAQLRSSSTKATPGGWSSSSTGKTIAEFPLTAGVIGAVIAPVAAAIGALSALIGDCTIEVEDAPWPTTRRPQAAALPDCREPSESC